MKAIPGVFSASRFGRPTAGQGASVERVLLNTDVMPVVRGAVTALARWREVFEARVEWLPQARAAVVRPPAGRTDRRLAERVDGRLVTLDGPGYRGGASAGAAPFWRGAGNRHPVEAATHSVLVDTHARARLRVLPLSRCGGITCWRPSRTPDLIPGARAWAITP